MNGSALATLWASIPSPPVNQWQVGPLTFRAYGLLIGIGMIVAVLITRKRYQARGGDPELVYDVALWAIPFGIVGARVYHMITSPQGYASGAGFLETFKIWHGGMAIMGGISLGVVGGWIALRRHGARVAPFVDSVAPALLVAQAIGRLGNWFNQELFGGPTTLPWGLEIAPHRVPAGYPVDTLFHPTFLYEGLWNLSMAALIVILDRRIKFKGGQLIWMYVAAYGVGRFIVENIRIDVAKVFFGLRLNAWMALLIIAIGIIGFLIAGKRQAATNVQCHEMEEDNVE
ncbi:MAG: prolipoprotein diacylglyceryl transferase [Actinomycetaceae bacterium]|nr:prolipoprotein diacylglyceryl transferase [Actinomycetaceae bacterium]